MTNVTKTANEYFLTQAQFDARKQAGTLEVGAVYHITDAHSGAVLYRHTVKFSVGEDTDTYDFFVVLVDNYDQAYTSESIMNKYGHCTFVGHQDLDGPPGGVAIIANSFTGSLPHSNFWYAMVKYYGDPIRDYLWSASFVSDTVTTF